MSEPIPDKGRGQKMAERPFDDHFSFGLLKCYILFSGEGHRNLL